MVNNSRIIFIDSETTGVDSKINEMYQLAMIPSVEGHRESGKGISINISILNFEAFDPVALKMAEKRGITKETILAYPCVQIAFIQIKNFLDHFVSKYNKHEKFIVVGYRVEFDTDFLRAFFMARGDKFYGSYFMPYVIDVYRLAQMLFLSNRIELKNLKLTSIAKYFFPDEKFDAHDALEDIKITAKVYMAMRDKFFPWLPEVFDV